MKKNANISQVFPPFNAPGHDWTSFRFMVRTGDLTWVFSASSQIDPYIINQSNSRRDMQ